MMPQDGYGNQPVAGNGDDGYWPPAPDSPSRGRIQQTGRPSDGQPAAAYPANAPADDYRPVPPGEVGGGSQSGKSTTLLDIIMGNAQ